MKEKTVNVPQAASMAGVSDSSITSWIREGVLPCITDAGQNSIIGQAALHETLAFRAANGRYWMRRFLNQAKPAAAATNLLFAKPETTKPTGTIDGLQENCAPDFMWCARVHGCEAMGENRAEAIRDVLDGKRGEPGDVVMARIRKGIRTRAGKE
jgi:hypothetical protein